MKLWLWVVIGLCAFNALLVFLLWRAGNVRERRRDHTAAARQARLWDAMDALDADETDALLRGRQVCNVPARRERLERIIAEREGEGA